MSFRPGRINNPSYRVLHGVQKQIVESFFANPDDDLASSFRFG
jgi:hypothetical protein